MSVNSKMTAIANAIRAKTGGTAALTLDGMASAVASIPEKIDTSGTAVAADIYTGKTATVNDVKLTGSNPYNAANVDPQVTSMLAALAEKGVDTSGKGLADIASLIAAIEAGGIKTASGTFTVAENTLADDYVIEHNLGTPPAVFILYDYYINAGTTDALSIYLAFNANDGYFRYTFSYSYSNTYLKAGGSPSNYNKMEDYLQRQDIDTKFQVQGNINKSTFIPGRTYKWHVFG